MPRFIHPPTFLANARKIYPYANPTAEENDGLQWLGTFMGCDLYYSSPVDENLTAVLDIRNMGRVHAVMGDEPNSEIYDTLIRHTMYGFMEGHGTLVLLNGQLPYFADTTPQGLVMRECVRRIRKYVFNEEG